MVQRHARITDRYKRLRRILLTLGLLSITAAIIWIMGRALSFFSSFGLLLDLDVEGLCLIFASLTLGSYRTVRKGDEQQIHGLRMVAIIGTPFAGLAGAL